MATNQALEGSKEGGGGLRISTSKTLECLSWPFRWGLHQTELKEPVAKRAGCHNWDEYTRLGTP